MYEIFKRHLILIKVLLTASKEYLTAEALADYMLGTHPDFKDSKYTSKLPEL
ncbi:hypothetical protein FOC39_15390 [Acinetobacter radioresistens]|nr:hypothetical protein FOC39_15390 [Acinetobacter radioresistens]